MLNKKGLSKVVTTLLIIAIGIVAMVTIALTVNSFIKEGLSGIKLDQLTLDLEIESAKVNFSQYYATVKVVRNSGKGELSSIKFIIEDEDNAEVYEKSAENFQELEKRTFHIDLTTTALKIDKIWKISIAPVYYTGSGSLTGGDSVTKTGKISDEVEGLNIGVDLIGIGGDSGDLGNEGQYCDIENPCGGEGWIGYPTCNFEGSAVIQDYRTYDCIDNWCVPTTEKLNKDVCDVNEVCYNDACSTEIVPCGVASDCGTDGYVGSQGCQSSPAAIFQDYKNYYCNDNTCSSTTTTEIIQECAEGQTCYNAECFEPVECTSYLDCWSNPTYGQGYICELGSCVLETEMFSGIVNSAWPYNIGEYFDSYDLPTDETPLANYYIIFNLSAEDRCMKINDFNYFEDSIPYIRLNETKTNVSANDHFQIWQTSYSCTLV